MPRPARPWRATPSPVSSPRRGSMSPMRPTLAGLVYANDGHRAAIRIHQPLARVAQLAIHLDRKVNDEGVKLNAQKHLSPLWGLGGDAGNDFLELLATASGIAARDIASHDLS